jgi:hypothetical protein
LAICFVKTITLRDVKELETIGRRLVSISRNSINKFIELILYNFQGHLGEGNGIFDRVQEAVRREAEGCDLLQGIFMMHSLGGGTGSGLGSALTDCELLNDLFPSRLFATASVFPSPKVSFIV